MAGLTTVNAEEVEAWRVKSTAALLSDNLRHYLTPWELRFVVDMYLWQTGLSDKQAQCLAKVIGNVNAKSDAAEVEKAEAERAAAAEKAEAERVKSLGANVLAFPAKLAAVAAKPKKRTTRKRKAKQA